MSGFVREEDDIISGINVTPLVDITLVLLIIFMVTATVMVNPAIRIDLPKAVGVKETPNATISLMLNKNNKLFVNGQLVTPKQARDRIIRAVKSDPKMQILIAADRSVKYQKVMDLINMVNNAGAKNFALNVESSQ